MPSRSSLCATPCLRQAPSSATTERPRSTHDAGTPCERLPRSQSLAPWPPTVNFPSSMSTRSEETTAQITRGGEPLLSVATNGANPNSAYPSYASPTLADDNSRRTRSVADSMIGKNRWVDSRSIHMHEARSNRTFHIRSHTSHEPMRVWRQGRVVALPPPG
jgi:hypothetical protein